MLLKILEKSLHYIILNKYVLTVVELYLLKALSVPISAFFQFIELLNFLSFQNLHPCGQVKKG